ncbi:conserved hypothetical protein [Vibrio phage 501E54-1]|nr:conserved hypothetical protein [Vibrio phage 501E54-1]
MNQTVLDITRELSVERDRWSDPNYLCVIYVKGEYRRCVRQYVETWWGVEKVDQRGNIKLDNGGMIKVVNIEGKSFNDLLMTCMGLEIATAIVQVGNKEGGFDYWCNTSHNYFVNYVQSRLRTEAKCSTRMVLI